MRVLVVTPHYERKLKHFLLTHPELEKKVTSVLSALVVNPFDSSLRTHKLSGRLNMCYGASINYRYRIVFGLDDKNVILLNIGSHDEVY